MHQAHLPTQRTRHSQQRRRHPDNGHRTRRALTAVALSLAALAPTATAAAAATDEERAQDRGTVAGLDVSGHQPTIDWNKARANGIAFTYVKATEGTGFRSDAYNRQMQGAGEAGLYTGAYHFARPDTTSGAEQANYFVDHGGDWNPGERTLPGTLDIENNPYGDNCYGLTPGQMSRWISDFSDTYNARTGRHPMIYTNASWWNQCTGNNPNFAGNSPLWIARYNTEVGELPAGWQAHTIWQHSTQGAIPGGQDTFNGTPGQLAQLAG